MLMVLETVGSRIAKARHAATKTQAALAKDLEVDVGTVSRWERGALSPSVDALVSIAKACKTTLDWLATGTGAAPRSRRAPSSGKAA